MLFPESALDKIFVPPPPSHNWGRSNNPKQPDLNTFSKPESAAITARTISKILKKHGFHQADCRREGYYVRRIGHSRSVGVDWHIPNYQPDRHSARRGHQVEQMREILFELGYMSSHPKAIYIECLQP
jgi:hypothetical protein